MSNEILRIQSHLYCILFILELFCFKEGKLERHKIFPLNEIQLKEATHTRFYTSLLPTFA